jgi:hypothetical protein
MKHDDHWLSRPQDHPPPGGSSACMGVRAGAHGAAQLVFKVKGYFGVDGWFGFGALFGFGACVLDGVGGQGAGLVLKRRTTTTMIDFLPSFLPALVLILSAARCWPALRAAPARRGRAAGAAGDAVGHLAGAGRRAVTAFEFLDYRSNRSKAARCGACSPPFSRFMAFAGGLFAFRQAKWYELAAAHAYAAGAVGVSFAGDLITCSCSGS